MEGKVSSAGILFTLTESSNVLRGEERPGKTIFSEREYVRAYSGEGEELWQEAYDPGTEPYVMIIDGTVYRIYNDRIEAAMFETGENRWSISGDFSDRTAIAGMIDGDLVLNSGGGVVRVDPESGETIWEREADDRKPLVIEKGSQSPLLVTANGNVLTVRNEDGESIKEFRVADDIQSLSGSRTALVSDTTYVHFFDLDRSLAIEDDGIEFVPRSAVERPSDPRSVGYAAQVDGHEIRIDDSSLVIDDTAGEEAAEVSLESADPSGEKGSSLIETDEGAYLMLTGFGMAHSTIARVDVRTNRPPEITDMMVTEAQRNGGLSLDVELTIEDEYPDSGVSVTVETPDGRTTEPVESIETFGTNGGSAVSICVTHLPNLRANDEVTIRVEATDPLGARMTASTDHTISDAESGASGDSEESTVGGSPGSLTDQPGFGVLAAIVALCLVSYLSARRTIR